MVQGKVLVTGAGGFIGSHLVEHCLELGYSVRALVRYNSQGSIGWLREVQGLSDVEVVFGDVRDYDSVERAVRSCRTVFHLAALIGIPYSYVSPLAYVKTNVEGTYNILEVCRLLQVENVLITSTSETYGSAQYVPMDERHPAVAQSPYAATKVAADQLAQSYYCSFGLPVKIVRPFNTFGPRQSARAVIPTILGQILSSMSPLALGNLAPTRDFTYVEDTVRAFPAIAACPELNGSPTNVGMNREISVADLATLVGEVVGVPVSIECEDRRERPPASEVVRLRCDNSRLLRFTDWRPKIGLRQGIESTYKWFVTHTDYFDSSRYNI